MYRSIIKAIRKEETMSYTLTMNKEQAEVICKALDLFSRIGCGQFEEILKHPTIEKDIIYGKVQHVYVQLARKELDIAKQMLTGHPPGVSTGITVADEPNRIAYDVFQVIRNRLAVDNNDHEHSVYRQDPMKWSDQPLPTIEEVV
jgi:hypothetical protein